MEVSTPQSEPIKAHILDLSDDEFDEIQYEARPNRRISLRSALHDVSVNRTAVSISIHIGLP
jgi:hypothetical protein